MVRIPNSAYGIPLDIVQGLRRGYETVNTVFLHTTIREWYRLCYRSYLMRSRIESSNLKGDGTPPKYGEEDEDGHRWVQLKPSTIRLKKSLKKRGKETEYLSKIRSPVADYIKENVLPMFDRSVGDGINIRTGRLLASVYPPQVQGQKLLAGKDQDIKIETLPNPAIEINSKVPWAPQIFYHRSRPLFEDRYEDVWMEKAVAKGLAAAKIEYDRIEARKKNDNLQRSKSGRNRTGRKRRGPHRS